MRYLLALLAIPLSAAPINTATYATLGPGEQLVWNVSIWNYYLHRTDVPERIRISLAGPAGQSGTLDAVLESPDGLESIPIALSILQGQVLRPGSSAPKSLAVGSVDVPATL